MSATPTESSDAPKLFIASQSKQRHHWTEKPASVASNVTSHLVSDNQHNQSKLLLPHHLSGFATIDSIDHIHSGCKQKNFRLPQQRPSRVSPPVFSLYAPPTFAPSHQSLHSKRNQTLRRSSNSRREQCHLFPANPDEKASLPSRKQTRNMCGRVHSITLVWSP